jgi:DNA (cytosine-5)-methyltransferase 1
LANQEYQKIEKILYACLNATIKNNTKTLDNQLIQDLNVILANSERARAVLAVLVTSLAKKISDSAQDVRKHQDKMSGGYSGRTLDTNVITPFLKLNHFPAMAESGWLTRSLEQDQPYTLDYRGVITPPEVKKSFLQILDKIQTKTLLAEPMLVYLLRGLVVTRDQNATLKLAKPVNLPIRTIISYLHTHFTANYQSSGASRLPVLAIHAAYQQMVEEVGRYKKCTLRKLESHTAADRKTGTIGDIQVIDEESRIFEGVEIKHQIAITPLMVKEAYIKFSSEPVKRYYLLTTSEDEQNNADITKEIIKISQIHGCQVIVNGVMNTLKYYLRLLKNPDDFIRRYVELVEQEPAIKFEHKQKWNNIITGNGG